MTVSSNAHHFPDAEPRPRFIGGGNAVCPFDDRKSGGRHGPSLVPSCPGALSRRPAPTPRAAPAAPPPCPGAALRRPALAASPSHLAGPAPPRRDSVRPGTNHSSPGGGCGGRPPPTSYNLRRGCAQAEQGRAQGRAPGCAPSRAGCPLRPPAGSARCSSARSARTSAGRGGAGKGVGPGPPPSPRPRARPSPCCPGLATWEPAPRGVAAHFPWSSGHGGTMKKSYTGGRRARGGEGSVSWNEPFLPEPRWSRPSRCPGSRAGAPASKAGFGAWRVGRSRLARGRSFHPAGIEGPSERRCSPRRTWHSSAGAGGGGSPATRAL